MSPLPRFSLEIATWLTYLLHSSIILGGALLLSRIVRREVVRAVLWKTALLGAVATTAIQIFAGHTPIGSPLLVVQERTRFADSFSNSTSYRSRLHNTDDNGSSAAAANNAAPAFDTSTANASASHNSASPTPVKALSAEDQSNLLSPSTNNPGLSASAARLREAWRANVPDASRWSAAILITWIMVATLLLLRLALRYHALRSTLRDRVPVTDAHLMATFAGLTGAANVSKPVLLSVSAKCASPMVLRRFEICVPARFLSELDRDQQHAALAHEVAHIAHGDRFWLLIASVLQAVFFFQPLHALLRSRMRATSEVLADDWAVEQTGSHVNLARCLMRVAEWIAMERRYPNAVVVTMAETGSPLMSRIERLLGDRRMERAPSPVRTVIAIAGVLLLVAWTAPRISCDCDDRSPEPTSNVLAAAPVEAIAKSAPDTVAQLLSTAIDPAFRRGAIASGCTPENSPSQGLSAMRSSSVQSIGIAVASGLFAACGSSPDNVAASVRSDSSGIAIVETRMTAEMQNPLPWIAATPEVRIGQVAGDPHYELTDVRGLVLTAVGNIVVGDGGSPLLKFYDSAGRFLKEVGGKGDGPGEARHFIRVHRCGAGLILARDWDGPASWWTTNGDLVGRAKFALPANRSPRAVLNAGSIETPLYYACSPHGKIVMTSWGDPTKEPNSDGLKARGRVAYATWSKLWLVDTAGTLLLEMPDTIIAERIKTSGGSGPHMFGRNISFALDTSRLFISYGDKAEVAIYSLDGKLRSIWRAPSEDLTLTPAMLKQYETTQLPPADSSTRRRYVPLSEIQMPATYPAFDQLHLTADGFLWARRFRMPWDVDRRWGLFGPDGSFLGYTIFPRGLEVFEIGSDYVLGAIKDSLDVPFVQLHRINRGIEGKQ